MSFLTDLRPTTVPSGSLTPIAVAGLGFLPAFLIVQFTRQTTTGTTTNVDLHMGRGFVASNGQVCVFGQSVDARVGSSRCGGGMHNDAAMGVANAAGGNLGGRVSFAIDADGYTMTPLATLAFSVAVTVLAVGGTEVAARMWEGQCPTSGGAFTATLTTGITPNVVLSLHGGSRVLALSTYYNTGGVYFGFGAKAAGSGDFHVLMNELESSNPTSPRHWGSEDGMLARYYQGATAESTMAFASFAADQVNMTKAGGDVTRASRLGLLAIECPGAWVGKLAALTGAGTIATTAPGFPVKALLSHALPPNVANSVALYTGDDAFKMALGISTGPSSHALHVGAARGGLTTTETYQAYRTDALSADYTRTAANTWPLEGDLAVQSFNADGFTLLQGDPDLQATQLFMVALGQAGTIDTYIEDDDMRYERKYGVATTVTTKVLKVGTRLFAATADWTPVAGDVKISKDGAAFANITTLPTALGNAWVFSFSATEMECNSMVVQVVDTISGKQVDDLEFRIGTVPVGARSSGKMITASPSTTGGDLAASPAFTTGVLKGSILDVHGGSGAGEIVGIASNAGNTVVFDRTTIAIDNTSVYTLWPAPAAPTVVSAQPQVVLASAVDGAFAYKKGTTGPFRIFLADTNGNGLTGLSPSAVTSQDSSGVFAAAAVAELGQGFYVVTVPFTGDEVLLKVTATGAVTVPIKIRTHL